MKRVYLILLCIALTSFSSYSQEKWRALTFNSVSGTDFKGNKFNMLTSGLHYDLKNRMYISNWNGVQFNYGKQKSSWFSSQTTINSYLGKWTFGAGIQYGMVSVPNFTPYFSNNTTYFISTLSYRFKLK